MSPMEGQHAERGLAGSPRMLISCLPPLSTALFVKIRKAPKAVSTSTRKLLAGTSALKVNEEMGTLPREVIDEQSKAKLEASAITWLSPLKMRLPDTIWPGG
jgi:hypothetical protein